MMSNDTTAVSYHIEQYEHSGISCTSSETVLVPVIVSIWTLLVDIAGGCADTSDVPVPADERHH